MFIINNYLLSVTLVDDFKISGGDLISVLREDVFHCVYLLFPSCRAKLGSKHWDDVLNYCNPWNSGFNVTCITLCYGIMLPLL